jgi:hypothetical protein
MYHSIICAIVVVMLASTAVVAKPRDNQTNGQSREQYCRQLVGPEKGEGEAGKTATMRSQIMRWDDCMMQRSPTLEFQMQAWLEKAVADANCRSSLANTHDDANFGIETPGRVALLE